MTAEPTEEDGPPYARIVGAIRARIASGELRPGDRVPSTRQITREWGVAMATATKALTALRREGLVHAKPGAGTVVSDRPGRPANPTSASRAADVALNRETIIATAMGVADLEGLAALSMRRVATELGVSTMALYRHVEGKDALVHLITDAAFTETPLPEPPSDWRRALEISARRDWRMYRRHPWAAARVSVPRPLLTPGGLANVEWLMRVLGADRPDRREAAMQAIITLTAFVVGMATWLGSDLDEEQETGVSNDQWWCSQDAELAELEATGRFPLLFAVDVPPDLDSVFEFGLARLLDGLAGSVEE
ncbi:DNA-binding transcriptional regulator YhcF (GntR family) [Actinoalloteichus hoggarensis]|uniref:Mannosyl-D-glycerate transport/metabolism system repressor MngR n=1 Tax=Actinoalloteichus hoggarensis TaxID=1470176 RepID=A0A221W5N3_9PSEU|nr:GntR family transcriptional regulator [Actinoalloteichus hoggarensis]ASO20909.1 Mannosyl-D-glycerate transport/metabolism system repressor MngR [Actinoalloteichus hoggarensis]MBB5920839.1 DNA-binding transcriptional regulator YhcF (GntR family) [Actinoalloteichus hoggarensis]